MSDQKDNLTRREALKSIGLGAGVIVALPVLGSQATAQDEMAHMRHAVQGAVKPQPQPLKFFTEEENRTVIQMSERIIPADASSPGATAAHVNEYIDLIVSVSPESVKQNWREGLAAINKMSREKFSKSFADASDEQQVEFLKQISKNEKDPKTIEERFFRTIKNATIDGYYTSEIGIKQELRYKGNSYLKEFVGCTHSEHQQ